jgi:hypothetical protein
VDLGLLSLCGSTPGKCVDLLRGRVCGSRLRSLCASTRRKYMWI